MKNSRKFTAMVAALALAACSVAPMAASFSASAADVSVTIDDKNQATYSAYKLLNLTYVAADNTTDPATPAKYAYTVNAKYRTILQTVMNNADATDEEIIKYISEQSTADATRTFADAVYANLDTTDADATLTGDTASNIAQGYYLIAQTAANDKETSLVILDTADNETITLTAKAKSPTFTKEIGDINDTTKQASAEWNAADYTWGTDADHDKFSKDAVPFRLTATLPDDYTSYKYYTLKFHDDLQENVFGNVAIKAVYLENADGEKTPITAYEKKDGCGSTHGTDHANGCDFTVEIANLKTAVDTATNGDKVVVEYTANFTDDTIVGSAGNWNTGLLEYSNNPYYTGEGDGNTTSKTPEVNVVAFTYKTVINKVDSEGNELAGAAFKLEKTVEGSNDKVLVKTFTAGEGTTFEFEGLDDGTYTLTEVETPDGYNGIKPIEFTVSATHEEKALKTLQGTPTESGAIEFTVNVPNGSLSADVENKSGSELPSTGGMGTTLFYLVGGVLVAGAGVTLITKKRVSKNNK